MKWTFFQKYGVLIGRKNRLYTKYISLPGDAMYSRVWRCGT